MEYSKFSYKKLFDLAEEKKLVLPNFQRDFVWKSEGQQQLLASFIVNLPVGSFLILEGEGGEFYSKELCYDRNVVPDGDCFYLLDGQQRLSTLKNIFSDHLSINNWKDNYDDLHFQLKNKWFIDLDYKSEEEDILGLENLRFKVKQTDGKGNELDIPKLLTLEPTEVLNNIKFYKIFKTSNTEQFYHPSKYDSKTSDYDKKLKMALKCADNKLLPLFDLLSNDKVIAKTTLKTLADYRIQSLKQIVGNNINLAPKYLGHLDETILQKYIDGKQNEYNLRWDSLKEEWVEDILEYFKDLFKSEIMIPTVKSNELARATSVFEYMNKGGTPLDTFDIMVAKYAVEKAKDTLYDLLDKSLRKTTKIQHPLSQLSEDVEYTPEDFDIYKNNSLTNSIKDQFLNLLSLLTTISNKGIAKVSINDIKKTKILSLKKEDIDNHVELTTKGLYRSLAFLQFRCGLFNFNKLSYKLMLLPIALILKDDNHWEDIRVHNKLEFWYWTSLFSGWYREKQNQRVIKDISDLNLWINSKHETSITERIDSVFEESNYSDLDTLLLKSSDKSVPTSIYNGILQYVLSNFPSDFSETKVKLQAWDNSIHKFQDHHIIPLGSATSLGQSSRELRADKNNVLNSPLNRTYISTEANNRIRAMGLNKYLPFLNNAVDYSHCIPANVTNNFSDNNKFYEEFAIERFNLIKSSLKMELEKLLQ